MQAIRSDLMAHNNTYRHLVDQHSALDSRIQELQIKRFLNSDEEMEEVRLKKQKLHIKDEMERMLREQLRQPA